MSRDRSDFDRSETGATQRLDGHAAFVKSSGKTNRVRKVDPGHCHFQPRVVDDEPLSQQTAPPSGAAGEPGAGERLTMDPFRIASKKDRADERCVEIHDGQRDGLSTLTPRSVRSSQSPVSSNDPTPTRPQVNVVSMAVITGLVMSSK